MVYILGAGMVRVGRWYDKSLRRLALEASVQALEASGVDGVDFVVTASSASYTTTPQLDLSSYIANSLGMKGTRSLAVEAGEASGLAAVSVAYSLVKSGAAQRVLVVGVDKLSEDPGGVTYSRIKNVYDRESEGYYGIGHAAIPGILMRLYMERYKVDRITMASWPVMMHANAKENPYAMLRFAVTPDKVISSMPVADPITLLDAFPLGDGAAALIISNHERESNGALARLAAIESSTGYPSIALREDPLVIESLQEAYSRLESRLGGIKPDLVEIHDSYTIMAYMILESLKLSEPGKAASAVAEGWFSAEGDGPTANPSGGLKARGHPFGATGVYQMAEASLQLAGVFPGVKVKDARRALVVSINGHGSSAYIGLLEAM